MSLHARNRALSILAEYGGTDFGGYKTEVLLKRIERYFQENAIGSEDDFLELLAKDRNEQERLFSFLFIGVTALFRDREVFDALEKYLDAAEGGISEIFRIWVAGCSTGEEVVSYALMMDSILGSEADSWHVFGTDISQDTVENCNKGIYSAEMCRMLPEETMRNHFIVRSGSCELRESIRKHLFYQQHNLLTDRSLRGMDLISCRNVLIYFQPEGQVRIVEGFYRALKSSGILVLGKSEMPENVRSLFECIDLKNRIFIKTR